MTAPKSGYNRKDYIPDEAVDDALFFIYLITSARVAAWAWNRNPLVDPEKFLGDSWKWVKDATDSMGTWNTSVENIVSKIPVASDIYDAKKSRDAWILENVPYLQRIVKGLS